MSQSNEDSSMSMKEKSNEADLYELLSSIFSLLRSKIRYISISIIISILGLIMYSLLAEERFTSTILISASEDDESSMTSISSQLGGLSALTGGLNFQEKTSKVDINLAILTSRSFLEEFIEKENLYPLLFEDFNSQPHNAKDLSWNSYKALLSSIKIKQDKKTGLIKLSITQSNAELASTLANSLIYAINEKIRIGDIQEAKQNIEFLQMQIKNTKLTEVKSLFYAIMQKQTEKVMLANVKQSYAFEVINPGYPPEFRSAPQRKLIVFVGTIVSFIIIILSVFVLEFFRVLKHKLSE